MKYKGQRSVEVAAKGVGFPNVAATIGPVMISKTTRINLGSSPPDSAFSINTSRHGLANDHVRPFLGQVFSVNPTLTELENVNSLATSVQ